MSICLTVQGLFSASKYAYGLASWARMLLTHDPNMEMNLSQEATPSTSTSSGVDLYHHISPEKSLSKTTWFGWTPREYKAAMERERTSCKLPWEGRMPCCGWMVCFETQHQIRFHDLTRIGMNTKSSLETTELRIERRVLDLLGRHSNREASGLEKMCGTWNGASSVQFLLLDLLASTFVIEWCEQWSECLGEFIVNPSILLINFSQQMCSEWMNSKVIHQLAQGWSVPAQRSVSDTLP